MTSVETDFEAAVGLSPDPDNPQEYSLLTDCLSALSAVVSEAEEDLAPSGPHDTRPAVCVIDSGAGGAEAADWALMLVRMYTKWAAKKGLPAEVLHMTDGPQGVGVSQAEFVISGRGAYGLLRPEHGTHRLARSSPHDPRRRRHTSFASVSVAPIVPPTQAPKMSDSDVRFDFFRSSGAGGQHRNKTDSAVRATHVPTGITATSSRDRSQHRNKSNALRILASRVEAHTEAQTAKSAPGTPRPDASWGHQIRSYVLNPKPYVKDFRTGKMGDPQRVLDGVIDDFLFMGKVWLSHNA